MAVVKLLDDFAKALQRLDESLELAKNQSEYYAHFRDSAIQRFEFTLEICWKSIKLFLKEHEGVECRSPKGCLREFLSCGYMESEEVAEEIFATLPSHRKLLYAILERLRKYSG